MSQTPEQIAERNRRNSLRSTGPTSAAGKARSSQNARTHGLTARVAALNNEDPEAVQARQDEWDDFYKPRSPAAKHLVFECVQATFFAEHVHQTAQALVVEQIIKAPEAEAQAVRKHLDDHVALLLNDPVTAVRELTSTWAGCTYLIGRWEALGAALEDRGYWGYDDWKESFRLLGRPSGDADLARDPELWQLWRMAMFCDPDVAPSQLDTLYNSAFCPDSMASDYPRHSRVAPGHARAEVRGLIDDKLAELRARAAKLAAEVENPLRKDLVARNLVLRDEKQARLFLRYKAEARTAFHRSYAALTKALKEEPSPVNAAQEFTQSNETVPSANEPAETATRNEATPAAAQPPPKRSGATATVEQPPIPVPSPTDWPESGPLTVPFSPLLEADVQ